MTILVYYSCDLCGQKQTPVPVPAREAEDVRVWMAATVYLIAADHYSRSPTCQATHLRELRIPMTGVDRIGGPPLQ